MSSEDQPRRISAPTIALMRKFVEAGKPIYRITSEQARRLMELGVIERPSPRGPYYLTAEAPAILALYDAQTARPKRREDATSRLATFVHSLPLPRISRQQIVEHLEADSARGVDTSPKIMRPKGRKRPQLRGKG